MQLNNCNLETHWENRPFKFLTSRQRHPTDSLLLFCGEWFVTEVGPLTWRH